MYVFRNNLSGALHIHVYVLRTLVHDIYSTVKGVCIDTLLIRECKVVFRIFQHLMLVSGIFP